ncbi:molybdate ABC transporter substrate-binding protein [Sulfuriflexus mobilis]|uniref:molybdate ABC transporter substrate-binding protein n=1 Tax=Sulfuriflexus mobilis TaxID=1811807 RepID=UPI000F82BAF2|nr:substrate-binding domain-containing protein [Sulfuriflexus mobilis]
MTKRLKWPIEASRGDAISGYRWQQADSNLCLDFHGNPLAARLVVFSDGNHHMALEACCQAFRQSNPDVQDIFYATTPPQVILQSVLQGGVLLGNLQLTIQPHVFISPANILDKLLDNGLMTSHRPFASSRGNVLLVKKGNPKNIHGIADLLREDVRLTLSNPLTEGASYSVYKQTLLDVAGEQGADVAAVARLIDKDSRKIVFGESIHHREVPQTLFSGRADVAMVYYHLALRYTRIFPDDFELIELESKANVYSDYHIGALHDGGEWGQNFIEFMLSDTAAGLYQQHGLSQP